MARLTPRFLPRLPPFILAISVLTVTCQDLARFISRFLPRFLPRLPPSSWLLEIFNLDSYLSRCGKVHIKIHAMLALLILTSVICKKLTRLGKILGKIQTRLNLLGPLLRLCWGCEISSLPWRQGIVQYVVIKQFSI